MKDFYEHIDDYINGLLESETLAAFEKSMADDPSLKLAVDNYESAKRISEGFLEVDMMQTLSNLDKTKSHLNSNLSLSSKATTQNSDRLTINNDQKKTKSNRSTKTSKSPLTKIIMFRRFAAAASIIGIMFFAGWWITRTPYSHLDANAIMANYIKPPSHNRTKSTTILETLPTFEQGKAQFDLNYFKESEVLFLKALKETQDAKKTSEINMWLGASYIFQGKIEKAVSALQLSTEANAKKNLSKIDPLLKQ